jgi:excisionase family DNA binding protein
MKNRLKRGEIIMKEIPVWEKANLSIEEAAVYFGIGKNKLRELTSEEDCTYVFWCGSKRLIKRKVFEKYLEKV